MSDDHTLICFDTETTGVDVENDRIVTAFIGRMNRDGEWVESRSWLINPGIDIPEEASNVHGVTTEHARANGVEPTEALQEIGNTLNDWVSETSPLVIYNAPYDLTVLDRELKRNYGDGLSVDIYATVVDPLVIDKATDKFRKGSRRLVDVAAHYGVPVEDNAHDAGADCLMAGRIAWKLFTRTGFGPRQLHDKSIGWKQEQASSFQEYLRRTKDPEAMIDGGWPIIREK